MICDREECNENCNHKGKHKASKDCFKYFNCYSGCKVEDEDAPQIIEWILNKDLSEDEIDCLFEMCEFERQESYNDEAYRLEGVQVIKLGDRYFGREYSNGADGCEYEYQVNEMECKQVTINNFVYKD